MAIKTLSDPSGDMPAALELARLVRPYVGRAMLRTTEQVATKRLEIVARHRGAEPYWDSDTRGRQSLILAIASTHDKRQPRVANAIDNFVLAAKFAAADRDDALLGETIEYLKQAEHVAHSFNTSLRSKEDDATSALRRVLRARKNELKQPWAGSKHPKRDYEKAVKQVTEAFPWFEAE